MFHKFRIRYPKGGLTSELIKIDAGQYLVQASIIVEGITLATGLAAAASIEVAEDQARNRALALLALDVTPAGTANPVPLETNDQVNSLEANAIPQRKTDALTRSEPTTSNLTAPEATPETVIPFPRRSTKHQSRPKTTTPAKEAEKTLNIDSAINLVTVEMKRLGWTLNQGRDYLLQTYAKSSRHLLTDEELLEFLEYLKTQ